ncbi:nitrate/nitrite transporter NarK [Homoserinimonas aerilata]|uniref:Lysosomal dipeptide transporter MFSD1 n=1 Tax=Homoserinimonas aerilata TaxID=1162970 RepID=A0A542YIJ2_9MICO|nr:MFS transporter [Homoserinimonas aerilata]TQL47912.1 nitrate/nitrite transporter NarK [Homoserinimonas aerilata]
MNSARSWLVWSVAVFAYLVAVLQRSSLGVAAVDASAKFDISASQLSTLAVLQLVVYAALQVPVGVLLDRVGPRALIIFGAALMGLGQVAVALAPEFSVAIAGRMLVGAGDAFTFISVLRLLSLWFEGRVLPQVSQWTGNIGQLGQILSAVPFVWILHGYGWMSAFLSAAAMAVLALVLTALVVRNGRDDSWRPEQKQNWKTAMQQLRDALRRPGTQLGFWSHFTTQSPGSMFALLWGFPLMVNGLGYDTSTASSLLTLFIVSAIVIGPILGILTARFPLRRSNLVLTVIALTALAWAVVLLWPTQPPFWLIVVLIVVLGVGGPGSLISFEFAREFNPMRSHGSATGFVNVGGFVATFVMMFLVGVSLDLIDRHGVIDGGEGGLYSWGAFRLAFLVQYLVLAVGVVGIVRARRRTRRQMHTDEGIEVAPLWVVVSRVLKRRGH